MPSSTPRHRCARPPDRRRRRAPLLAVTVTLTTLVVTGTASAAPPGIPGTGAVAGTPANAPVTTPSDGTPGETGIDRLPVDGAVQARFVPPESPWSAAHRGIDLRAEADRTVRAPGDGTVTFSGVVVDRPVVTLTHPDGLRSSLEPVVGTVDVGTAVAAGDPIGTVASSSGHCAPRTCVHWGVRSGEVYLDPLGLLPGSGPVVLLPVDRPGVGR